MLKAERAAYIEKKLGQLYPDPPIPLKHNTRYQLLIAVLLSAQCTDARVNQVTPELFAIAPTPEEMRKLAVNEIYKIIRPCGLAPKKSRAISGLSEILIRNFEGEVPDKIDVLETLPGVGHKTASVVVAQGFGKPSLGSTY